MNANIYKLSYDFLVQHLPTEINIDMIEEYFDPDNSNCLNLRLVFDKLIGSSQNYQHMPKVIGYYGDKRERIISLLFDLDFLKVSEIYSVDSLFQVFKKEFNFKIVDANKKSYSSWYKFSKSVVSASNFLKRFKDIDEFKSFINHFAFDELTKVSLPMILEKEISGFGFALSCDFLKELGYVDYCKPDVHLMDVFSECGLCNKNQYDVFKFVVKTASENNVSAYKLDKIIWLICSGAYYKHDIVTKKYKKEFIEYLKENLG